MRGLFYLLCLCLLGVGVSCQRWQATDRPISGVKVERPQSFQIYALPHLEPGKTVTMRGAVIAGTGADSVITGVVYSPRSYEVVLPALEGYPIYNRQTRVAYSETLYADSFLLPLEILPGRYLFYSLVHGRDGTYSDTNRTYRYLYPRLYPLTELQFPRAQEAAADVALTDSVQVRALVLLGGPQEIIDSIVASVCSVGDGGRLTCTRQYAKVREVTDPTRQRRLLVDTIANKTAGSLFTTLVELPAAAQVGQLFRTRVVVYSGGFGAGVQPLVRVSSR